MAVSKSTRAFAGFIVTFIILSFAAACSLGAGQATIELPKEAVSRKVLANGLTVLAKPSPPQGLVAIDVKILAGSSLEGEYLASGISHLVEHMVFKGTSARGAGVIEREIKSYGGIINGSTSSDITDYHILLPSEYLPQGLAVLKDMLSSAIFDDKELAKEKEVVLKEINLNEDEPQSRLIKRLYETAYLRHPYKYPTIGYAKRFKALGREDLISYYNRLYVPNRMVISIVGGVDALDAITKTEAAFVDFRAPDYGSAGPLAQEPTQIDQRKLEEASRANLAYLAAGFHSTGILDEDLFAMDVLAMILGRGDNSRLNTSLVKNKRLVYSVSAWNSTPRDPGLFVIIATLDEAKVDGAEGAIMDEVARLRRELVSDQELASARRMVLADFIASLETVDAQANDMGLSYMLTGSPDFSRHYVEGAQAVTKEDVKRVANKYLKGSNLTVVRLVPAGPAKSAAAPAAEARDDSIKSQELPNGLRILLHKDAKTPTVSITAAMLGGLMVEGQEDNGISNLTAQMLLKGTKARREHQIKGLIEELGGSANAFSGFNAFGVKIDILKNDLETALDITKDILANSEFQQEELEKEKALTLAAIREEDDDIFATGVNALRKTLFGKRAYGLRYIGEEPTIKTLKREDLMAFYKKYVVPDNMALSVSGDINIDETLAMIKAKFSDLSPKKPQIEVPEGSRLTKSETMPIQMDKAESLILLGFETTSVKGSDRYVLEVLGSVLSGHSGRLFDELRNRLALAYALGCAQKLGLGRGYFAFYIATTKENSERARKALEDEIDKVRRNGVTDEELALAKRELRVTRQVARQENGFYSLSAALDELYGLGYDNLYRYDAAIEKVSKEEVKAAAQKYFDPAACAEVVISPRT